MTRLIAMSVLLGAGMAVAQTASGALPVNTSRDQLVSALEAANAPGEAYESHIRSGIAARSQAYEEVRRTLLLCRSPLLQGVDAPYLNGAIAQMSSDLVPEVQEAWSKKSGSVYARQRLLSALSFAAYSTEELQALLEQANSREWRRAKTLSEMLSSIEGLQETRADVNSGLVWFWPIAHVRMFMRAQSMERTFLRAVDHVVPGASVSLAQITGAMDQRLSEVEARPLQQVDWGVVKNAFFDALPSADQALLQSAQVQRYANHRGKALLALQVAPFSASAFIGSPEQKAQDACGKAAGKTCSPDVVASVMHWQQAPARDAMADTYAALRLRVRQAPESGCLPAKSR